MIKSPVLARAVCVIGLASSAVIATLPAYAADKLTVVSWGGAFQEAQRKAFFEPFAKETGTDLTEGEWNGETAKIRAMVETKTVSWDVVVGGAVIQLCAAGILETINWDKLGYDPEKFPAREECAVPASGAAAIIAYDKEKFQDGPTTITDVFDLEKFPGKRGLNKRAYDNLEWALIADGVAPSDVYDVLSTEEGVDRAFAKLDTIKRDVVWWESGAQPAQLLADGQVVMSSAWNGRIYDAVKTSGKPFQIMWDAAIMSYDYYVIPAGAPNIDIAYKFISFALAPERQAHMADLIPYAPSNPDATALVDEKILPYLPTAPENSANSFDRDEEFWADHSDDLEQRFSAWLAQ